MRDPVVVERMSNLGGKPKDNGAKTVSSADYTDPHLVTCSNLWARSGDLIPHIESTFDW